MESIFAFFAAMGIEKPLLIDLTRWVLVFGVLGIYLLYRRIFKNPDESTLIEMVREDLFTVHGVVTSIIHVFIVSGMIACYIVGSQALGYDGSTAPAKTVQGKGNSRGSAIHAGSYRVATLPDVTNNQSYSAVNQSCRTQVPLTSTSRL